MTKRSFVFARRLSTPDFLCDELLLHPFVLSGKTVFNPPFLSREFLIHRLQNHVSGSRVLAYASGVLTPDDVFCGTSNVFRKLSQWVGRTSWGLPSTRINRLV